MYIWILARGDIFANDHLGKYLYSQAIWGFDEEKFLHSLTRQILPLINRYGNMGCQASKQGIKNYIYICGKNHTQRKLHTFFAIDFFWQVEFLKLGIYFLKNIVRFVTIQY
jgi:hypothetical protein